MYLGLVLFVAMKTTHWQNFSYCKINYPSPSLRGRYICTYLYYIYIKCLFFKVFDFITSLHDRDAQNETAHMRVVTG